MDKETIMVNEIKMDNVNSVLTTKKLQPESPQKSAASETSESDVTITNSLSKYVNLMISENYSPEENMRVLEMKHKIETNSYHIDADALARKLLQNVISKING